MYIVVLVGCKDSDKAQAVCRALMDDDNGRRLACEAIDSAKAPERAAALRPDVLLLEHREGARSLGTLTLLRTCSPATRSLLLLDARPSQALVVQAIRQGASGCIQDSESPALLAKALRKVHGGESWFGRRLLFQSLHSSLCPAAAPAPEGDVPLTQREQEIMNLIGTGLSNKEIGRQLDISDKTVKTHLHRVYAKLNRSGRYKAFLAQPARAPQDLGWATMQRLRGSDVQAPS